MLRRFAYLIVILAVLVVLTLPIIAFTLAARGELMLGSQQGSYLRLFMVNEDEAEGIGVQRVHRSAVGDDCWQGSVRYLVWEGQSQGLNASYCTCYDAQAGQVTSAGHCTDRP